MQEEQYILVGGGLGEDRPTSVKVVKTTETVSYNYEDTKSAELLSRVDILIQEVEDLVSTFKEIALKLDTTNALEKDISSNGIIIVEEMDKMTAKEKVIDFMKEHNTSDIEELHQNLRMDIGLLVEIIDELCSEGIIAGGD